MKRYLKPIILSAAAIWAPAALSAEAPAKAPNILFILADDLGYGELGCYGQTMVATPNLDRMAKEGMRFTQFYAGASVCAPSRSVLMTGLHAGHTRVRDNGPAEGQTLHADDTTVAEVLKQAGYATGLIGKWGLGDENSTGAPWKKGFDEFYGFIDQTHAHNHFPSFLWRNDKRIDLPNDLVPVGDKPGVGYATKRVRYANHAFFDEAADFIERHREVPFFLELSLTIPHANNERSRVLGDGMEVPDYDSYAERDWPDHQKGHAAMNELMDRRVGELLKLLGKLDLADRTLVMFSSDNGPHREGGENYDPEFIDSNGDLRGIKRDPTDGGIRVPMIAWWPGQVPAGVVSDHVSYFGDLMATWSELAGVEPPPGLDSISLVPTLLGVGEQPTHDHLYWEFHSQGTWQAVVLGDRWKALRRPAITGDIQLYDLKADIGESRDLAADRPEVVARAAKVMQAASVPNEFWDLGKSVATGKPQESAK